MNRSLLFFLSLALAAFVLFGPANTTARASTIYDLNFGNSAISGYTAPYGTAEVFIDSNTTAHIVFTAASDVGPNHYYYLFGDGGTVGVNVNATAFSFNTQTTSGGLGGILTPTGTIGNGGQNQEDGFGKFNLVFDVGSGASDAVKTVTFNLVSTSGPVWASAADVLKANEPNGAFVAAHVFVYSSSAYPLDALATGYAAGSDGREVIQDVPEPASMTLLGIGFVGMAGYGWRRRRLARAKA